MQIEYCVPTLNRPDALARLVASIERTDYPHTLSISHETAPRDLPTIVNELFAASTGDIVVILADHVELSPDTGARIAAAFEEHFPDLDGVVGLHIENMDPLPGVREFCFPAVGRQFIERFHYVQVFCPDYYHFYADTELGLYAMSVDRFHHALDARVINYHFANQTAPMDGTHRASRTRKAEDRATWDARQALGLLWGASFERVNP